MSHSQAEKGALAWEVRKPARGSQYIGQRKPRAVVELDGGEQIFVPASVGRVLAAQRKAGEVHPQSRAELLYIIGQLERTVAWSRVADMVNHREYSSKELGDRLRRDGFPAKVTDECVRRAVDAGIVDDRRYADVFVRGKVAAGWGRQRIERELKARGIEPQTLAGWPWEYLDADDERDRAYELARRHTVRGPNAYQKLVRYLVGRGYGYDVAKSCARRVLDERAEDE